MKILVLRQERVGVGGANLGNLCSIIELPHLGQNLVGQRALVAAARLEVEEHDQVAGEHDGRQDGDGAHRIDVAVFRRAEILPVEAAGHSAASGCPAGPGSGIARPIRRSIFAATRARCTRREDSVEESIR